jgi:excisionase family DNA binding protein
MQTEQPQPFTVSEPQALAYSIPAASKVSGVGRSKLYEAIASGALRVRKNGAKNLILRDDLQHWLQSLPTAAPSPKPRLIAAE